MKMKKYPYRLEWINARYEFESLGPKGRVRKAVLYDTQWRRGKEVTNLGLCDWSDLINNWIDNVKTNNDDTNKVLATVAATCLRMVKLCPFIEIYAQGSNHARNRLYQMGINNNWNDIKSVLEIEGWRDGRWEPFCQGINYEAFLAKPKTDKNRIL